MTKQTQNYRIKSKKWCKNKVLEEKLDIFYNKWW